MISTKSFLHDRFFVNNSKHNLLKYNINVINKIKYVDDITNYNVNILKQVFNLAITKFKNNKEYRLFDYSDIVARFYGIMNNIPMCLSAFYNNYEKYSYIEFKTQLHFEQKILEYREKIAVDCIIKKFNKYTQLWLINNCKKLINN